MKKLSFPCLVACAALSCSAVLLTSAAAAEAKTEAKAKGSPGQIFVRKATQGGMTEIKLSELASQQAENAEVKEFGAMMVTDHTKMSADLKAAAEKDGLKVPAKLNKANTAKVEEMAKLSGTAFDKAYVAAMVTAHETDSAAFTEASQSVAEPEVKAAAGTAVPIINGHLEKVKALAAKMK